VTNVVGDDSDDSDDGAEVRQTAAAVERTPGSPREPSGKRRAAVPVGARPPSPSGPRPAAVSAPTITSDDMPVVRPRRTARDRDSDSSDDGHVVPRRRSRSAPHDYDDDYRPRRSAWPLVAGLGLLAGVAVVFGVPSIRAKVMGFAGDVAGREPFDPSSLAELEQAQAAIASLDPLMLGKAETALQTRLDGGNVPPAGVVEMQLAQAELLATRALDHAIGRAAGAPAPTGPTDDVERSTQLLGALDKDHVIDGDRERRVRALVRLAQGRPAKDILGLLPEDGSGELRRLVEAAPLWRDPTAALPEGAVAGLEGLPERSTLAQLALALAYLRAGDETRAQQVADGVLSRVPAQPTALALRAKAGGGPVTSPAGEAETPAKGKTEGKAPADTKAEGTPETKASEAPSKPDGGSKAPRTESTDALIDRGCRLVESGDAGEGLEVLRKAQARRANDLDLLVCIGKAHAKQGRPREALESYEDALRAAPRFAEALQSAARVADKLGDTDKAKKYYRRLLAERPGDAKALAYLEAHGG
jgi:tetratricopeptide (TPR) repeat protein